MQVTINMPDILTHERIFKIIKDIEERFLKEGISFEIRDDSSTNDDSWNSLNLDEIAVDTGIEDFAENHDHYLYGTPKR